MVRVSLSMLPARTSQSSLQCSSELSSTPPSDSGCFVCSMLLLCSSVVVVVVIVVGVRQSFPPSGKPRSYFCCLTSGPSSSLHPVLQFSHPYREIRTISLLASYEAEMHVSRRHQRGGLAMQRQTWWARKSGHSRVQQSQKKVAGAKEK